MKSTITIAILCILLGGCGNSPKTENTPAPPESVDETTVTLTDAQVSNSDVRVGTIHQQNISSLLKVNGKIEVPPQNMVSVSVPMGGYLKSTKLLAGMHIAKGESIAVMEDQQYIELQQNYLVAKVHLVQLEAEFNRQKELNHTKAGSDKVFQQAQTEYFSQKILLKGLEEKLRLIGINPGELSEKTMSRSIPIASPIDGFVSQVKQNIGKYVAPTDVLFELVNPADIHLTLTVFEKDLHSLSVGQKLIAYTNTEPSKKFACEIILIGKDVSPERTVQVQCHFEKYDKSLIPGMYMNAEVEVATSSAYVIDNDGLVRFEGKQYVFTETGKNTYAMLEVTTGNSENGMTQITASDTNDLARKSFVTKGAYTLLMKMKNKEEEK